MPSVHGITIPSGWEGLYYNALRIYNKTVKCVIGKKRTNYSREFIEHLRAVNLLKVIGPLWRGLNEATRENWRSAAGVCGMRGYNLFIQDKAYRIANSIAGLATPSDYHQYLIGRVNIGGAANEVKIEQKHVTPFTFPASFSLCRKTDLTADGPDPYAKFIFSWNRYWRGQTIKEEQVITIPLSSAWTQQNTSISIAEGIVANWKLILELHDVTGNIWFDNMWGIYESTVHSYDPKCENVIANWQQMIMPTGASLATIYPTGGAL